LACQSNQLKVIEVLLQWGARANMTNASGFAPVSTEFPASLTLVHTQAQKLHASKSDRLPVHVARCIFACLSMSQHMLGLHIARCHVQLLQSMLALPLSSNAYLVEGVQDFARDTTRKQGYIPADQAVAHLTVLQLTAAVALQAQAACVKPYQGGPTGIP